MLVSNIKSDLTLKLLKFRYKETYGMITSENLDKFVAMVTLDNLGNKTTFLCSIAID